MNHSDLFVNRLNMFIEKNQLKKGLVQVSVNESRRFLQFEMAIVATK